MKRLWQFLHSKGFSFKPSNWVFGFVLYPGVSTTYKCKHNDGDPTEFYLSFGPVVWERIGGCIRHKIDLKNECQDCRSF